MKDNDYWQAQRVVAVEEKNRVQSKCLVEARSLALTEPPYLSKGSTPYEVQKWRQNLRALRDRKKMVANLASQLKKLLARIDYIDQQILRTVKTRANLIHEDPFQ